MVAAVLVLIGAGAFLIGPPPDNGPSTSAEALEASEAESIMVEDPVHERPFDVSVWEPTGENRRDELVVISHGFSADRTVHATLAQGLVAEGYTVAAPTHPDIAGLESGNPGLDPFVLRPRHLSLTIDAMSETTEFDSITLVGHSLGGYSALRMVGADPVVGDGFTDYCDNTTDALLCSGQIEERISAEGVGTDFSDPRVDRIVLLAPGYGPFFDSDALDVDVPVLVIGASDDSELPGDQVSALATRMPNDSQSETVNGGHYVFMRPCTDEEASSVGEICEDADGVDRAAVGEQVLELITDFADA